jgi:LPXTG-motif cell wall-anchored protein
MIANSLTHSILLRRARRIGIALAAVLIGFSHMSLVNTNSALASASAFTQLGDDINGVSVSDLSGWAVAMSADGTRIVVGAVNSDSSFPNAGHVRVYNWSGTAWIQLGNDIDGEAANDNSGYSVTMSADGSRIAIGAPYNSDSGSNAGHVRVYEWNSSAWVKLGNDIDGEAANDNSGSSVTMSADGSRIAIGAPYNDGGGSNAGHVRVYEWNSSAWVKLGNDIDGERPEGFSDQLGYSVAMSANGTRIVVGAGNLVKVRVYDLIGSTWTQVGPTVTGEDGDGSGSSVAMSANGTRIVVGAYNSAKVRVYDLIGSTWTQAGLNIDGETATDQAGYSIAMSADGTRLIIGAFLNAPDNTKLNAGHARIYIWSGNAWTQLDTDIDGEADGDYSGYSVTMSADGTRVAIGAISNDGTAIDAGHVRAFSLPNSPSAPTINSVTAGNNSLTVSLTTAADGGLPITNYEYSTDGTNYVALNPASNSSLFTISGLTNGTNYSITIKAVNAIGDSPASNAMNGTPTAPATIPDETSTTTSSTVTPTMESLPATGGEFEILLAMAALLIAGGLIVSTRRRLVQD